MQKPGQGLAFGRQSLRFGLCFRSPSWDWQWIVLWIAGGGGSELLAKLSSLLDIFFGVLQMSQSQLRPPGIQKPRKWALSILYRRNLVLIQR